jgi:uncharacterized protein YpmS
MGVIKMKIIIGSIVGIAIIVAGGYGISKKIVENRTVLASNKIIPSDIDEYIIQNSNSSQKIKEILETRKVTVSFDGARLVDALNTLGNIVDTDIVIVDPYVKKDTEITLKVSNMSLKSALRYLLEPHGLTYAIEAEAIAVGTQNDMPKRKPIDEYIIYNSNSSQKIKEIIETKKVTVSFDGARLVDALNTLGNIVDTDIVIVDPYVKKDTEITLKVSNMSLKSALRYLLEPHGLIYAIEAEAIAVGTQNDMPKRKP